MSLRPKHLLLATLEDIENAESWSGTPHSLRASLECHVDQLTVFRPSRPQRDPWNAAMRVMLGGKPPRWPLHMTQATLRKNARELSAAIRASGVQAVLSISSGCIARLDPFPVPTYMFSDAPWLAWKQAYAAYDPMPLLGPTFAKAEMQAAARCDGLFFGSNWAVNEAERLYYDGHATQVQRNKLHVTPLGANWRPDLTADDLLAAVRRRPKDRIDLLFVGRDWERKGGPLAVEVVQQLRAAGANACLHIVGCSPQLDTFLTDGDKPVVRLHGALYKDVPEERVKLQELFLQSHVLLIPTMAECFGITFAEAQAFGLPPVTRNIQALPTVVVDGETGLLMAPNASAHAYAERVLDLMANQSGYLAMAECGIERAATVTNWDVMAKSIVDTIFQD